MLIHIIQRILIPLFLFFWVFSSFSQEGKIISGIVTEEVKTKEGTVKITRTAHLPRGKAISGTIVAEPDSEIPRKRKKQAEKLANLVFKIGGEIISGEGIFTTILPDSESASLQVFKDGNLIEEISFEMTEPVENAMLDIPKTIRKGYTEKITGNFSGDINQARLMVDEKLMDVVAGNENELYFETGDVEPGKQELSLEYDEVNQTEDVNVVDYTLEAGRLTLNRGESTFLNVSITGLEDLQEPLQLDVRNQSAETIKLEGGDIQQIQIFPSEVSEAGTWEKRFDIQSIRKGSFSVSTDLIVPEEKKPEPEDATKYVEQAVASEAKVLKIGRMKLVNPTDETIIAGLHSFYIPSTNGHQGYMIPEAQRFDLPPDSETWVDIEGYCTDFELPTPEAGSELPSANEWIQIEDPKNVEKINELMIQEDIQKRTLTDLKVPMNVPGTNRPITHAVGREGDSELLQRLLMAGLTEIIDAFNQLEEEGKIEPAFSENNKEKTVQAAFWEYAENIRGNTPERQVLENELEPEKAESVWKNIELIGKKAKIIDSSNQPHNESSNAGGSTNEGISPEQLERAANNDEAEEVDTQANPPRRCLEYPTDPDIDSRVGWDLFGDLYRNGHVNSDYLNDLRAADIHRKLQKAKSLNQSLQLMLKEDYFEGYSCNDNLSHRDRPQEFPDFPWEELFLTIDLCDEANAGKTRLIDFLSPDADIEAVNEWRDEFEKAVENFGLSNTSPTSMLGFFSNKTSSSMEDINEAYDEFQENMRVALALRYNASRARARMWEAVAFTAGAALSAGLGGVMAGSMGAALVSTFVSTTGFVYEQGLQSLGMQPEMAQLVSAIATAGMGGLPSAGDLVNSATTTTILEGANAMAQSRVESYSMSMALMDDDNWDKMIENLSEDYRAGAINSFNRHRNQFIGKVHEELSELCEVKNSLDKLIPATEKAVNNAKNYVSSSYWRSLWGQAMDNALDCSCCEFSDGKAPSRYCRQTIPPFGFSPDELDEE